VTPAALYELVFQTACVCPQWGEKERDWANFGDFHASSLFRLSRLVGCLKKQPNSKTHNSFRRIYGEYAMAATGIAMMKTGNRGWFHNPSPSNSDFRAGSADRADDSGDLNRFWEAALDAKTAGGLEKSHVVPNWSALKGVA